MLKESLPPVREKLNQSYVSSCSEDETSHEDTFDSSHHADANLTEAENEVEIGAEIEAEAEIQPAIEAVINGTNPNVNPDANSNAGMYIATVESDDTDTNDALQTRISSLEEQLQSLALVFQSMQNDQSRASNNQNPPPCDRLSLPTGNEPMLESESPPPADRDLSEIVSVRCAEDELVPTPGLEYRSFTPTYEEELRKIRKTSRGMSLDQSDTSSVHAMKNSGSSGHLDKEEKKEDAMHSVEKSDGNANMNGNGNMSRRNSIQNDIVAEGKDDKSVHKNKQGKPPIKPCLESPSLSSGLPPKSPSRISLASMNASTSQSSKLETESTPATITTATTTYSQLEEKMNTNAVLDFIRGLNIDSRQQDGSATEDVDVNMEEFLRVPFRIEKLLLFGLAVCFDCFLYVLTVTPLKFVWSLLCLVCTIVRPGKGIGICRFHRRHLYQLLRVFVIWFTYQYVLCPISLGRLYHWIRGQAMLKLYVLMAMVVSCISSAISWKRIGLIMNIHSTCLMYSIRIHVRTLTLPAQSMCLIGGIRQTHVFVWTRCIGQFILEHDETSLSSTHDCKYGSGASLYHYSQSYPVCTCCNTQCCHELGRFCINVATHWWEFCRDQKYSF